MIYINRVNNSIFNNKLSFVISDFDRTITESGSATSWSIIPSSNLVNPNLKLESEVLFNKYRKIELNNSMPLNIKARYMENWALEQINLYNKYNISKYLLNDIIASNKKLKIRKDFRLFVNKLKNNNIRLYIVSAGIYDVIKYVLLYNDIDLSNIKIISNHLVYSDNIISGIKKDILHSCNKDSISLSIDNNEYGLLFGDQVEDILIGNNYNTINIGFMNSNCINYDIVLTNNSSFSNISKILIKE